MSIMHVIRFRIEWRKGGRDCEIIHNSYLLWSSWHFDFVELTSALVYLEFNEVFAIDFFSGFFGLFLT